MTLTVYGLKKCSTCREATALLKEKGIEHGFVDVRAEGIDRASVARWTGVVGLDKLLNRRGLMWRHIPAEERTGLDEAGSIDLMVRYPSLIKRPLFDHDGTIKVGFTPEIKEWLTG
jgi:Spx/MgsR family transcriptional regulator